MAKGPPPTCMAAIVQVLVVVASLNDPRFRNNGLVTGAPPFIFFLFRSNAAATVVDGRHFWFFCPLRAAEYILYPYLIYHLHTLCIYTTMKTFSRPPAVAKGCTLTMAATVSASGFKIKQMFYGYLDPQNIL